MPFPIAAALIGGGSVLSGILGSRSANRAADAQTDAARQQAELERRALLMQANLQEPQRGVGYQALGDLSSLYGYTVPNYTSLQDLTRIVNGGAPGTAAFDGVNDLTMNPRGGIMGGAAGIAQNFIARLAQQRAAGQQPAIAAPQAGQGGQPGNMSRFFASPDYQFRVGQAVKGLDRSAAARGGATGGNNIANVLQRSGDLASGEYGNYWNRLAQLSGMGQVANQAVGNAGQQYAAGAGQAYQNAGDARASGIMNSTNALTGSLNNGLNTWLMQQGGWFNRPNGSDNIVPGTYRWG